MELANAMKESFDLKTDILSNKRIKLRPETRESY
jgi:hypothetical protein